MKKIDGVDVRWYAWTKILPRNCFNLIQLCDCVVLNTTQEHVPMLVYHMATTTTNTWCYHMATTTTDTWCYHMATTTTDTWCYHMATTTTDTWCYHMATTTTNTWSGLENNILRQWTTGPPALRIWWSGKLYLTFSLEMHYRTCTVKHSYLTHTHSVLTVYHLNTG